MPTYREMMEIFDSEGALPPADYTCRFDPEFKDLPEAEQREVKRLEAMSTEELVAELREDPNVQAVLEAAEGMEPVQS